ncbi:MAG: DUF3108 domain-containing protein [Deltaproteobacteria bacterium]|nr:MAG: DUF3108 domain-containing protein [Deltaproteobacteria bacterium]
MAAIGGLLCGVGSGCAGVEATPLPADPLSASRPPAATPEVGLNPGETMAFEVRLAGIVAGEAQLAVGELGDYQGHRAVVVKSRAATAGAAALVKHIVDEATTVIDMATGRPLALETRVEQGNSITTATAQFTDNVADITYQRSDEKAPHRMRLDFGRAAVPGITVHDAHSAMAQLRGWRATPGTTRTVFVVGGRRLWRIDVTYAGQDTVGSVLGNRRAIRFNGASFRARRDFSPETAQPSRTFTVWLSDDADRVPLKVAARTELGDLVMELSEYSR